MDDTTSPAAEATPVPAPDRLPGPGASEPARARHTLLIRTAKLVGTTGEALCVVRDASAERIRIKTFAPLPREPELELEMPGGERHRIVRLWEDGEQAEFAFVCPTDIAKLVAQAPAHLRKREISLNCLAPAVLSAGSGECDVWLLDISQHGAQVECELHLAIKERVHLASEALPPLTATVEWRRAPFYRVLFDRVFAFDELARLCGVIGPPPPPEPRDAAPAPAA